MTKLSTPPVGAFVSTCQTRVLYADIDAMNIVYNGVYFRYFEQARNEYLRQRGHTYAAIEERGFSTPVVEAYAHYYSSFCYDDIVAMECWVDNIKRASFRFEYRLFSPENPNATKISGFTTMAIIDKSTQKICPIPSWLLVFLKD